MKKLYEKNELKFSLVWIALYIVLFSVADNISKSLGTEKLITAPLCIVITLFLWCWIKKSRLTNKYGLCRYIGNARQYLYFLPLIAISTINLWGGVVQNLSGFETALYMTSMLCVGFLEEVIFRGFLFKALCKDSVKMAFIISSLSFGIGHIVNLVNGAELLSTLFQIVYATAIGFLYTVIFYKGKSLIPCIISHALINMTSVFAAPREDATNIIMTIALSVISVGYAVVLLKSKGTVQGQ